MWGNWIVRPTPWALESPLCRSPLVTVCLSRKPALCTDDSIDHHLFWCCDTGVIFHLFSCFFFARCTLHRFNSINNHRSPRTRNTDIPLRAGAVGIRNFDRSFPPQILIAVSPHVDKDVLIIFPILCPVEAVQHYLI